MVVVKTLNQIDSKNIVSFYDSDFSFKNVKLIRKPDDCDFRLDYNKAHIVILNKIRDIYFQLCDMSETCLLYTSPSPRD